MEKDIQDIQDIKKNTGNNNRKVAHLPQKTNTFFTEITSPEKKNHCKKSLGNLSLGIGCFFEYPEYLSLIIQLKTTCQCTIC